VPLTGLGAALAAASLWLPVWVAPDLAEPRVTRVSAAHDGWAVVERLAVDKDFLGSTRFSQSMLWGYERAADGSPDRVRVFLAVDDRLDGGNRGLSPKTRVPGSGWEVLESGEGGLPGGEWLIVHSIEGVRLVYHARYGMQSLPVELGRSLLGLGRGPLRRPGRSTVVRLSTEVAPGPSGVQEAKARLDAFLASFREELSPYTGSDGAVAARR
jgi:hypothetical protein